jgi:hypothetical protein
MKTAAPTTSSEYHYAIHHSNGLRVDLHQALTFEMFNCFAQLHNGCVIKQVALDGKGIFIASNIKGLRFNPYLTHRFGRDIYGDGLEPIKEPIQ